MHEQKLREAQEIAEAVTDAEVQMGKLLSKNISRGRPSAEKGNSEVTFLSDVGITKNQSSQFQQMAAHPESVQAAKEKAKESGEILSRSAVLRQIIEKTAAPDATASPAMAEVIAED